MGHVKGLSEQLGKLGRYKGEVVEGWLSAVECMLEIKERTDPDGKVYKEGVPKGLLRGRGLKGYRFTHHLS